MRLLLAALLLAAATVSAPLGGSAGPPVVTLTLVRHAQSEGNAADRMDTSVPGPALTELGRRQAETAARELAAERFDGVYASPMVRTQQTAAPLADALGEPVVVLPGLREIEAGVYEGLPESVASAGYFAAPLRWLAGDLDARIPGSVDGHEFDARFDEAVRQICADGGLRPVAFSHGAAITLWVLLNVDNPDPGLLYALGLRNTGRIVVTGHPDRGWTLVEWDGVPVGARWDGRAQPAPR